ncbi:MAG: sulfatase-like hydrolase/transferase [Verrucomicrobia bacterium]|nr:sulfatase-like hydrolase/transferase [Verrucomicrobiota bacterium]
MFLVGTASAAFAAAPAKPNILLLIADDYGAGNSSLYNTTNNGQLLPPTPNIASIASNGVVFRYTYANPLCSPTRACLLTGRYGFRTGIGDVVGGPQGPLSSSEFTLPRAFSTNVSLGYQLAQFGKWHLAGQANSPLNLGGWTNYVGNLTGQLTNYFNWQKTSNNVTTANTNYATTDLVNDATNWIAARGTNPWFLWAAFNAPHTPHHLPPTNLCPHYANLSGTTGDINANPVNYFNAMTEAMDTEIGRLLTALPDRANTHIIFLGDNGSLRQLLQAPYPTTNGKDTLYEGGLRVPLIISGPAVVSPNRTNDTLARMVDLYATILEMAGSSVAARAPAGVTIDSQSLMPALQTTNTYARPAYAELFGSGVIPQTATGRALRNPEFKLIRFNSGTSEFYDLASDPYEGTNLFGTTLSARAQSNYDSLVLKFGYYQTNFAVPTVTGLAGTGNTFGLTVQQDASINYSLWRAPVLDDLAWVPVTNAVIVTNGDATVTLTDPGATNGNFFYRAMGATP